MTDDQRIAEIEATAELYRGYTGDIGILARGMVMLLSLLRAEKERADRTEEMLSGRDQVVLLLGDKIASLERQVAELTADRSEGAVFVRRCVSGETFIGGEAGEFMKAALAWANKSPAQQVGGE